MPRLRNVAALAAMLPVLGCARQLQLSFVNDSGRPVSVALLGGTPSFAGGVVKNVRVRRPTMRFAVTSGGCSYLYELPGLTVMRGGATTLQIETDYSIYASHAGATRAVADLADKQPSGFPLQPLATTCPAR